MIAIENVRLFKELEDRNRQLTESLEQQTATSEILGVIASSPTDTQPVLDTVIANAVKLAAPSEVMFGCMTASCCRRCPLWRDARTGCDALQQSAASDPRQPCRTSGN